jgi:subtilase family serine protease
VTVASGDEGSTQNTCDVSSFFPTPTVATPASDPLVLAAGGTALTLSSTGLYQNESAWTQVSVQQNNGAGGGGESSLYGRPDYQDGFNQGSARGLPDVSFDADPNTGYIVTCSFCNGGTRVWFNTGGTSFAAPAWAGLIALADQIASRSLGFVNPALYAIFAHVPQAFNDLTSGTNSYAFVNSSGQVVTVPGSAAVPGWDAVTGLGSPNASVLLPLLAA